MQKTFINPTDTELRLINRELLSIKIHYSSFTVKSQYFPDICRPGYFDVDKYVYPIGYLKKFFRINGKHGHALVGRDQTKSWAISLRD